MFKPWKSDKRIKASFKLQFQAFQVPTLKKPALVISLMPDDVKKPTFKLEKAAVADGACIWENPVYLTVKFNREPKTGKLHEKLYHFIVSSGHSKSGYLGESSVDLADYADEYEPVTISLPLKFANSGVVLHLTIQRLVEDGEGRFIEPNEAMGDEQPIDQRLLSENGEQDQYAHSGNVFSDARQSSIDWSNGSDASLENSNVRETRNLQESPEANSIDELKAEIKARIRSSELMEIELQSLRKQVAKEGKKVHDLTSQLLDIRKERDALLESKQLQSTRKVDDEASSDLLRAKNKESREKMAEMRNELDSEKEINRELNMKLEKAQQSNCESLNAIRELYEMIDQKDSEIFRLSEEISESKNQRSKEEDDAVNEVNSMKKQITDLSDEIKGYRDDREKLEDYVEKLTQDNEVLEQEKKGILGKLDQSSKEVTKLTSMVRDLESQVKRLEETVKNKASELLDKVVAINELESHVKEVEKENQRFESDLETLMKTKVEEEERAVANKQTTEKLQEEMAEAVAEAEQLRSQKKMAETKLQKANEELLFMRKQSNHKAKGMSLQLETKSKQQEQALLELNQAMNQMKEEKKVLIQQKDAAFSEIQFLKQKLASMEEKTYGEGKKKEWNEEKETLIRNWDRERDELEKKLKANDEQQLVIQKLTSEIDNLKSQQRDLSHQAESNKDQLLQDMAILKESNGCMEHELKELRERYSEVSLKFAEVESERQQLAKIVRTLKGQKS